MKNHNEPDSEKHKLSLLLASTDGMDVLFKVGILEAHNIHVISTNDGVGAITGEGMSIYPEYEIYVPEEDLSAARNILEELVENYDTDGWEEFKRTKKREGWVWGPILMLVASMFFATLAYFALQYDEVPMAWVLGGGSFFCLLIMLFSFDRSEPAGRGSGRML